MLRRQRFRPPVRTTRSELQERPTFLAVASRGKILRADMAVLSVLSIETNGFEKVV